MKKIIFAFTLVLFAVTSMAQTATTTPPVKTPNPAKVEAKKEVKTDLQTLKQDEIALKTAKKSKDAAALAVAKQKVQADRVALKTAVKQAKAVGVNPPKGMAKQIAKRRQAVKARHK